MGDRQIITTFLLASIERVKDKIDGSKSTSKGKGQDRKDFNKEE